MTMRERTLTLLRVPHQPSAPAGDRDIQIFRAAPNFYRYQLFKWLLRNLGAAVGLYFAFRFSFALEDVIRDAMPERFRVLWFYLGERFFVRLLHLFEYGAILVFLLQALGGLLLVRLDFEQRWYIVTDRSLRIRAGLVRLHEKTMTYANLQHVSIRQGPLQRILRIADIEVVTAGGGPTDANEKTHDSHAAYFEGIADAAAVRDIIRERVKQYKDAGLGDPDERLSLSAAADDSAALLLQAARGLAEEAGRLRRELVPR